MDVIEKLISVAREELGYLEKASNKNLYNKTANAGYKNFTKYWQDIKPSWQGQPWCAIFVTWCFEKAFGKENARKLLKHYPYTYCPTMANLFTLNANPKVGDIVIFKYNGQFAHTGIVVGVMGDYFETIEGNTNNGNTNASESLKENNPDEIKMIKRSSTNVTMKKVSDTVKKSTEEEIDEMKYEKRRMGSVERQLYNRFTEREQIESEELNKIAKIVLGRIIDKLKGTDFSKIEPLDYKQQVEKLVRQATSHENLCQSYLGWCPFW